MSYGEAAGAELRGGAPVCLYLDIHRGQRPDLEAVANAALAFNAAIKELSFVLDPSQEIKVDFLSGTEGSLFLNSIIRFVKSKDLTSKKNLYRIAAAIFIYFAGHTRDYGVDKFLDKLIGLDDSVHLSETDKHDIISGASEAVTKELALSHVQDVYRHVYADSKVIGIGVSAGKDEIPTNTVPRSEFLQRSGNVVEHEVKSRVRKQREILVLVSPVLLDARRLWEFSGKEGKLSAAIGDTDFLSRVLSGSSSLRLKGGIHMDVDLETKEELIDNVWRIKSRTITRVHDASGGSSQTSIEFP